MRNILAFLAAATLTFFGLGWYLDWYQIKTDPGHEGHHNVNIDINSPKIVKDVKHGMEEGEEKLHQVLEKSRQQAGQPTDDKR